MLAVTSFEATNSVFKLTDKINSFSISAPGHWTTKASENIDKLINLLELRCQNDIELRVEEIEKKV